MSVVGQHKRSVAGHYNSVHPEPVEACPEPCRRERAVKPYPGLRLDLRSLTRYCKLGDVIFRFDKQNNPLRSLRLCVEKSLRDLLVTDFGDHVFSFTLGQHQGEFIIQ